MPAGEILDCQTCHRELSGMPAGEILDCQACHRELSGMPAGEILDCQACHREKSWNDYRFLPLVEMTDRQKKFN
jgi:primosomal protein N'